MQIHMTIVGLQIFQKQQERYEKISVSYIDA